jgi:hypothetical protein
MAGFEGTHVVSDMGRVRTLERVVPNGAKGNRTVRDRVLKPYKHTGGYVALKFQVNHKPHHRYVHRLVCETWHGPGPEGHEVLHRDGDKTNNTPENLRWGTRYENIADNGLHGIKPIGEGHGMAKLTNEKVLAIRADSRVAREIAVDYGISREMVGAIKRRHNWRHI